MRRGLSLLCVCAGVGLLALSWSFASQPFGAPDEPSHFLRALSISQGHLLGPKIPYTQASLPAAQRAYVNGDTRGVFAPAAMSPTGVLCENGQPDVHGCEEPSPTGDYFPLPYLLPALGLKIDHHAIGADRLARLASVLPCILLLLGAVLCLWDGSPWSLLGPLGALSPMVFFVCSILNPSGMETAATVGLAAGVLRICRAGPPPRWVWPFTALSAFATVLAFQAGPGFLIGAAVLGAGLLTRPRMLELVKRHNRELTALAVTTAVSVILWVVYAASSGSNHVGLRFSGLGTGLHDGFVELRVVLRDSVGHFGTLTIAMPGWSRWLWLLSVCGLVVLALVRGDTRGRLVVVIACLIALLFPVASFALIYRFTGFNMQARQVLGMLVLIPLVAGEVVRRSRATRAMAPHWDRVPALALGGFALFQGYAWWVNAHISAWALPTPAPSGIFSFHARWSPPLGWAVWVVVALFSIVLLLAAAVVAARRPPAVPEALAAAT